jgi:DNA-binding transcriptional regulator YiaG
MTNKTDKTLKTVLSSLDDDIEEMSDAEVKKELETHGVDIEAARERLKKRFHSVLTAPEGDGWEVADPVKHAHELERFSAYGGVVDDALEAPIEVIEQQMRVEGLLTESAEQRQRLENAKRLLDGEPSGDAFEAVRHALGLSQSELAKLMKQRVETISRWENGHSDVRPLAWLFLFVLVDEKLERRSRLHERASKESA